MDEMLAKSQALLEATKTRRSCRKFLPDALDMAVIENCVLTAGLAPNGADKQPWHFCIVTSDEMKQKIRQQSEAVERTFYEEKISDTWRSDLAKLAVNWEKPFLTQAPCLIVIFKEMYKTLPDGTKDTNYYVGESVGIATGFLINALHQVGLASLTYTPAPMGFLNALCNRPKGEIPEMILAVGKADSSYDYPTLVKKSFHQIAEIL